MHFGIEKPADYRAGLYIRLSKEDENEGQSESVNNQLSLLTTFAREQGLSVTDSYIDDGYSGGNYDRPGFLRLLGDIETKKVNLVITKDLSRLGRDYILTGHYLERYFPEHQVRYISLLDGIDTGTDATANEITPFRAIMNDMYAKDISKKIRSVKWDKQQKGLFIGGKAVYGYKISQTEKNKLVIDESAAVTVRRVFGMAAEGVSCRQIAERLNAEGVQTPAAYAGLKSGSAGAYAGLWSGERISEMLRNETYLGNMVQRRRAKVSYKSKKCHSLPKESWVVVENTHAPLVDKETFDQVQALLESRRSTRNRKYDFLLKGLIFCHECGYPLAVLNRKTAGDEDCLYFVCRSYQRSTKSGLCTSHTIKEARVTQAVLSQLCKLCETQFWEETLLLPARQAVEAAEQEENRAREPAALRVQIRRLSARLDRIYLDWLNGILADADFTRIYEGVKQEREALEEKLQNMEHPGLETVGTEEKATALVEQFRGSVFSDRALICSLVERVELTENKEVILRLRCKQG